MGKTCIFEFPLTFAKLLFFKLLLQLFNFPPQYYQSFLFGYFYFYFFVLLEWRKIIAVSLWQSTNSGHQPWCCLSHVRGNRVLVCLQVCTKRPAPAQYGHGGHRWKKPERRRQGGLGRVGKQGLPVVMEESYSSVASLVSCDQTIACTCLLSPAPLSQRIVSAQQNKWAPCHLLTGVWKLPKITGRSSILPGWTRIGPQMSSWHQALTV